MGRSLRPAFRLDFLGQLNGFFSQNNGVNTPFPFKTETVLTIEHRVQRSATTVFAEGAEVSGPKHFFHELRVFVGVLAELNRRCCKMAKFVSQVEFGVRSIFSWVQDNALRVWNSLFMSYFCLWLL